jgi:hypothetical protein
MKREVEVLIEAFLKLFLRGFVEVRRMVIR